MKGKRTYFERLLWPECQRLWPECQRGDFIITIVDWYDAVFLARSPIVFLPCLFSTTRGKRWKEPFVLAMWHTKESKFEFWSLCIFLKSAALSFNYDWLYWIEKNVLLLYEVFFFFKVTCKSRAYQISRLRLLRLGKHFYLPETKCFYSKTNMAADSKSHMVKFKTMPLPNPSCIFPANTKFFIIII